MKRPTNLQQLLARKLEELRAVQRRLLEQLRSTEFRSDERPQDNDIANLLDLVARDITGLQAAITALADGSYGICHDCHEPIAPKRLAANPLARFCIRCQDQQTSDAAPIRGRQEHLRVVFSTSA